MFFGAASYAGLLLARTTCHVNRAPKEEDKTIEGVAQARHDDGHLFEDVGLVLHPAVRRYDCLGHVDGGLLVLQSVDWDCCRYHIRHDTLRCNFHRINAIGFGRFWSWKPSIPAGFPL